MDFEPKTKRLRLATVHPGVSVQQVVENSGFDLVIPKDIPTTELPTHKELALLRAIDPNGIYIPKAKQTQ
jgi:glutaconate CoA-transferase subunit B